MNKTIDTILFVISLIVLILLLLFYTNGYAATVTDNNRGTNGYILVNNGIGSGHQGTWTDPNKLPAIVDLNKALNAEVDSRIYGDKTLQSNLDTETSKRVSSDTNLQNNINTINENSKGRDIALQTNIDNEATARSSADNTLQSNINNVDIGSQGRDSKLQNNINTVNSRIDDVSNRVSKLERTQYTIRTELKFIREKHLEVGVYSTYSTTRNTCAEVGLNVVIPVGESYQDRENKKVNERLSKLEQKIGNATVIERTVDNKGNIKSIRISEDYLAFNGDF